jgi:hypothetical protein
MVAKNSASEGPPQLVLDIVIINGTEIGLKCLELHRKGSCPVGHGSVLVGLAGKIASQAEYATDQEATLQEMYVVARFDVQPMNATARSKYESKGAPTGNQSQERREPTE